MCTSTILCTLCISDRAEKLVAEENARKKAAADRQAEEERRNKLDAEAERVRKAKVRYTSIAAVC